MAAARSGGRARSSHGSGVAAADSAGGTAASARSSPASPARQATSNAMAAPPRGAPAANYPGSGTAAHYEAHGSIGGRGGQSGAVRAENCRGALGSVQDAAAATAED